MTRLRLSRQAQADLDAIQDHGLETFGARAARRHMAGFKQIFGLLRDFPEAGAMLPDFGVTLRTFSHAPHILIYAVRPDNVLIVRILHHRRDIRSALADLH